LRENRRGKAPYCAFIKNTKLTVLKYRDQETKKVTKKIKRITQKLLAINQLRGGMLFLLSV